jgi:di/tricarboxylate transporter
MEIALVLTILVVAIILFATEWIRMDLVSLMVLLTLAVTGLVSAEEAFSGFSNPAVITVAAMFIISAAISHTGALGRMGERLIRLANGKESRLIALIMVSVALFSAFINNIGSTAVLMPVVMGVARKMKISPSILLIPLAFGSILGGVCTLIGTPPNLLMNALLQHYTGESFAMFDFTPVGLVVVAGGILYMTLVGRHLLPKRKSGKLTEEYQVKEYITEVEIIKGSPLAGLTIAHSNLERDFKLKVRGILRENQKIPQPRRNRKLREGDILFLEGNPEGILKVRQAKGLEVVPERDNPPAEVPGEETVVVEASITPTCEMVGKNLSEVRFLDTYGINVLAIWRRGEPVVKKVGHVALEFGDVLLLQGPEERIIRLGKSRCFLLLGGVPPVRYRPSKAPIALATLGGVIALATTGVLPITLAATLGALIMVLSRCLTPLEAYESVDWRIIMLIAGTLPLGLAMQNSGTANLLANLILDGVGTLGPWAALATIILITSLLTGIISNAATVVLIAPIAYNTAIDFAVDPKSFFMAVAIAASSSFMTPISHQSNTLVMGPGGYRFLDFVKVGTPLNFLVWIIASLLVPLVFPF